MENGIKTAEQNCLEYAKEVCLDDIDNADKESPSILFTQDGLEKLIKYCLDHATNQQEAAD